MRLRIVSLLPSATEIVCALGFRERLVGRSHECDFPPDVKTLPVCTAPRFDAAGSGREIDRRVRDLAADALSLSEVKEQVLARLHPTVIVTQTQCDVCAVSYDDVVRAASRLGDDPVEIVALTAATLDGIFADIRRVAAALDAESAGAVLAGGLKSRVSTIAKRAGLADGRPRVACLEWLDPPMAAGHWIPELLELAGAEAVLSRAGEPAPRVEWADVAAADPDSIVVMACGFDLARADAELAATAALPAWRDLRAVREGRVFLTDANRYFSRPGPRIVDSLEIVAELVRPGAFTFGHEGTGWRRWEPPPDA